MLIPNSSAITYTVCKIFTYHSAIFIDFNITYLHWRATRSWIFIGWYSSYFEKSKPVLALHLAHTIVPIWLMNHFEHLCLTFCRVLSKILFKHILQALKFLLWKTFAEVRIHITFSCSEFLEQKEFSAPLVRACSLCIQLCYCDSLVFIYILCLLQICFLMHIIN